MSCEQQGTDTNFTWKPVQRYVRQEDSLDMQCRSGLHGMSRNKSAMPEPLNFMGRKLWPRPAPVEARSCVPGGISGVYRYTGPVLESYGIEAKKQIMNLV